MPLTGSAQTLRTADVDEARAFLDPKFYSSRVVPVSRDRRLSAQLAVTSLPDLTISDVTFGADIHVAFPEMDCYHINVPLTGSLQTWQSGLGSRDAVPGTAAVYQPFDGQVRDRWSADCRAIGVKVTAGIVDRELHRMVGDRIAGPLRFGPGAGARPESVASWCRLLRWLQADAFGAGDLVFHPLLSDRVQESVVAGLLTITDHQFRERLEAAGRRTVPPKAIRKVVDAIEAQPEQPYTLASLAAIAGLSTRALQEGFRRHVSTTPMNYLRDVRLAKAHDELRLGQPPDLTVAAVAHRWGFLHLGRFSQSYRARYGSSPSETLRS